MYLEKWHADRVHGGRAYIRYLANLHWGPVRIGYTRHLQEGAPARTHMRFGAVATPAVVDGALANDGRKRRERWILDDRGRPREFTVVFTYSLGGGGDSIVGAVLNRKPDHVRVVQSQ